MGFYFGESRRGTTKIRWFQAVPKAPNDTAAAVTYAFALYGTGRTTERIEILKKVPDRSTARSALRGLRRSPLRRRQLARNRQPIHRHRASRPRFPEKKQLLEEIARRRRGAAPPFSHDVALPSSTPSRNKLTP
jgi:Flp pilus assembly protein TadD